MSDICRRCSMARGGLAANRRAFLQTAGATVLAAQSDVLQFASSLLAAPAAPAPRPRAAVVWFRKEKGGGCVWPPSSTEELAATQQMERAILEEAAGKFGVDLEMLSQRVVDVAATLQQVQQAKLDGLIVIAADFDLRPMIQFCLQRGEIPTIVYGNIVHMGRSFEPIRRLPKTLLAHTDDVNFLATAVRMLRTLWDLDHLKLLDCPGPGYYEELKTIEASDEVKAIAEFYTKNALSVEPGCAGLVLDSAKHYVLLRRLMERSGCNGVTVSGRLCTGAGTGGFLPACMALSKLLDEGVPAACQGSHTAAYGQRLALSLFGRYGFMGNLTFDSVENHLILSHCTSALRLEGVEQDYRAPYALRRFHANQGVSIQAYWPVGKEATILDRMSMDQNLLTVASARIVAGNEQIRQPPCGGCRTVVEFALDWEGDIMDLHPSDDLHASAILGNVKRPLVLFAKLAGLTPVDIAGKPLGT